MDNRIKTIADHYGYEAQSRQCMEECAELIQAINKYIQGISIPEAADMLGVSRQKGYNIFNSAIGNFGI